MSESLDSFVDSYKSYFKYNFDNEIILRWYSQRIIDSKIPAKTLLELGVGHGLTTPKFFSHFSKHVVIEGSGAVINQFRETYPHCNPQMIHSYFEDFQTSEKFDVIVMGFVLEHVDDPLLILNHFKKFLSPEGRCFVAVPNGASLHREIGLKAGLLKDLMLLGEADLELGHKRLYTVKTISEDLEKAGYEIVRKEGVFLKPFTTSQLQSLKLSSDVIDAMCQVGVQYPELSAALLLEAKHKAL
ncbi:MAG: class I SAM-dependent methyltransferase [Holosporales bacterium]|nr:class I SAM-dependent methyltransferase [Holosporales bacterium]